MLRTVTIPSNSELEIIEEKAFNFTRIKKFIVPPHLTKICNEVFVGCKSLKEFEIPSDSKLKSIGSLSFQQTKIETFSIPTSLVELKEGWNSQMDNLKSINVSPENPRYSMLNNNLLVSKMSLKSQNFDEIIWIGQNKKVTIPNYIKKISCLHRIESVEFQENSQLEIIGIGCFGSSLFEKFIVPSNVTQICDNCNRLKKIRFEKNSSLQSIGNLAFTMTSIGSFYVPPHLKKFGEDVFNNYRHLKIIEFDEKAEIQKINIERGNKDQYKNLIVIVPPKLKKLFRRFAKKKK